MTILNPQTPFIPKPGSSVITTARPTNPTKDTTWKNPVTGLTETFDGKMWHADPTTSALQVANNLSDVASASSARTNLGLGTIATQNANQVNFNGGVQLGGLQAKSGNYTMLSTDCVVNATGGGGGITITLPAANSSDQIIIVRKVDAGAGAITVSRAGADTIEGANTISLAAQYAKCLLQSDGTSTWYRIV